MSTSTPSPITIRPIEDWEEYLAAEDLQRVVWQMPDWRDVVPANLLVTAQKNGGLVIGAFDADSRLVGLAFSFLGFDHDRPLVKQCSHMLAVLPEYQSQKIGIRLKLEQRLLALAQDISLMTWTYDPLLSLNAHLNIARLGAIARRYVKDAYGEMTDGLNAGLASDRFEVEWWLKSRRVSERLAGKTHAPDWDSLIRAGAAPAFEIETDGRAWPRIVKERELGEDCLLVEIPSDMTSLKAADLGLARDWRSRTRSLFQRAFAAGYVVSNFSVSRSSGLRAAYVLTREPVETGA